MSANGSSLRDQVTAVRLVFDNWPAGRHPVLSGLRSAATEYFRLATIPSACSPDVRLLPQTLVAKTEADLLTGDRSFRARAKAADPNVDVAIESPGDEYATAFQLLEIELGCDLRDLVDRLVDKCLLDEKGQKKRLEASVVNDFTTFFKRYAHFRNNLKDLVWDGEFANAVNRVMNAISAIDVEGIQASQKVRSATADRLAPDLALLLERYPRPEKRVRAPKNGDADPGNVPPEAATGGETNAT